MKKITILAVAIVAINFASCKKDRDCECTTTTTSSSGTTTTSPAQVTTLKEVSGSDAKSLCQKSTMTNVNNAGQTSTTVDDCKLK